MDAFTSVGAARAASANDTFLPARPARLSSIDRLAEHMAQGCPSLAEAARRMCISVTTSEEYWRRIRKALGAQAA